MQPPGFEDVDERSFIAATSIREVSEYLIEQDEVEEDEDGSLLE